ncbi:hypothetical protein [Granulicoccus phenolivorans]|uniref:hypothetical protein n=1 Tax=Granulicoccus phenolivorans TaxID=266854 RepID=UPI00040345D4|nr:hypothetical protein [Granulicoccus phenolivorans]
MTAPPTGPAQVRPAPDPHQADPPRTTHPVRGPRPRLTGAELEARLTGWLHRRRTAPVPPEARARRQRRILLGTAATVALTLGALAGVTGDRYETTRAAGDHTIATLEHRLAGHRPVPPELADRLAALGRAADHDAGRVATGQQRFAELYREADTTPPPRDGVPGPALLAIVAHRRSLADLFAPSAYVASDAEAYRWSSVPAFDEARQIDPRYAWYIRYDGPRAAAADTYRWEPLAVLADLGSPTAPVPGATRARVSWVCRDTATGDTLAWAAADYTHDGTRGRFDHLELVVTTAGDRSRHPTGAH